MLFKRKKFEVQGKVRFLLVENKLPSVDTALQTRGYIWSAYTHITFERKTVFARLQIRKRFWMFADINDISDI